MKTNVISLEKDFWKQERLPSKEIIIAKAPRKLFQDARNYTAKDVCSILSVTSQWVYEAIKDGLEAHSIGHHWRLSGAALNEYLYEKWKRKQVG